MKLWYTAKRHMNHACRTARNIVLGSQYRKTVGETCNAQFPLYPEDKNLINLMSKFTSYDLTSEAYYHTNPLNDELRSKLNELIAAGDPKSDAMRRLLERCQNPKFVRKNFDGDDILALEKATFELVKEFTPTMVELFNSGHLANVANDVQDQFGLDYYEAVIAEVLARSIAYNTHLDGCSIPLPAKQADGSYATAEFTIRLYAMGDDLPAYVVECKDENGNDRSTPWLVVRGTETSTAKTSEGEKVKHGGFESLMADLIHEEGVAEGVVERCVLHSRRVKDVEYESLADLFANRQFKMTGHSLGGNIVNQLCAYFYDNVEHAYGFGSPGVSEQKAELWERHSHGDAAKKLFNIQTEGDIVPAAGKKLIGTHLALTLTKKPRKADPVHIHVLMALTKPFKLELVDKELEEMQSGRRAMETVRRKVGAVFKKVNRKILKWDLPEWYVNRDIFVVNTAMVNAAMHLNVQTHA